MEKRSRRTRLWFVATAIVHVAADYSGNSMHTDAQCSSKPIAMNAYYDGCTPTSDGSSSTLLKCINASHANMFIYMGSDCSNQIAEQIIDLTGGMPTCFGLGGGAYARVGCFAGNFAPPAGLLFKSWDNTPDLCPTPSYPPTLVSWYPVDACLQGLGSTAASKVTCSDTAATFYNYNTADCSGNSYSTQEVDQYGCRWKPGGSSSPSTMIITCARTAPAPAGPDVAGPVVGVLAVIGVAAGAGVWYKRTMDANRLRKLKKNASMSTSSTSAGSKVQDFSGVPGGTLAV